MTLWLVNLSQPLRTSTMEMYWIPHPKMQLLLMYWNRRRNMEQWSWKLMFNSSNNHVIYIFIWNFTEWTFHDKLQFNYIIMYQARYQKMLKNCRGVITFISKICTCYPFTIAICWSQKEQSWRSCLNYGTVLLGKIISCRINIIIDIVIFRYRAEFSINLPPSKFRLIAEKRVWV